MGVAPFLQFTQLSCQMHVRGGHLAESHECAHDGDVNLYGALTSEHGREHRHAFLRERMRPVPAPPASHV